MPLISIGIGTHKRPAMLAKTLASLVSIEIPTGCNVQLILVDNAPEEPAESTFHQYKNQFLFPAFYFQEPKKGLVHMRNKILQEAMTAGTDFLAFMDDDEIAHPDWLMQHYKTHLQYHADVVSGRTLRLLPENTPQWMITGGFFNKGNCHTGIVRPTSSTCNVFFDFKKICIDWGMCFDPRLNFIGGEDILFFRQAHERGAKIIWSNESIVEEMIPESRATQEWLLERAFATGVATAYRYRLLFPAYIAYARVLFFLLSEYVTACTYFFRSHKGLPPIINKTHRLRHIQLAKGLFNGLFNKMKKAEIYKQHHGF